MKQGCKCVRIHQLFHTLRYLKPQQLIYLLYYRTIGAFVHKQIMRRPVKVDRRSWLGKLHILSVSTSSYSGLSPSGEPTFGILNEVGTLNSPEKWNDSQKSKLWLYNLHYLDDINSHEAVTGAIDFTWLVTKWITDNADGRGNGWEPYPLSLRIVNLVKWMSRQDSVPLSWVRSLGVQAQALNVQLEYHLGANHLFANAKALIFAGSYLTGASAERWLKKGLSILDREIQEQFLYDGGHYERSPMYHGVLLWDMCDLINLAQATQFQVLKERESEWRNRVIRGLQWMRAMIHPDGEISFFNDATFGIAPSFSDLCKYAKALQISHSLSELESEHLTYLCHSGYAAVEQNYVKLIVDLAPVGPNYQPGHAHADTLSFEMSLYGHRLLVNSGISKYGVDAERHRQRSTEAHNTVVVDGENSSDIWAGFRVAYRAEPQDIEVKESNDILSLTASHNGYLRLPGKVTHTRRWILSQGLLDIHDTLDGRFKNAEARFHVHPDIAVTLIGSEQFKLDLPSGDSALICFSGALRVAIENTMWHPFFGISLHNQCLVAEFKNETLLTQLSWESS